jgi:hypothetical protein
MMLTAGATKLMDRTISSLSLLVLLALPALCQDAVRQPDAIDLSVHDSVEPVSDYFPGTPNTAPSAKTGATSFIPLRPVYKTQPSIWFRPLQYVAPAPGLAKPAVKPGPTPPLTLAPAVSLPASLPALSNPFFFPGFPSGATGALKPAASRRRRKAHGPAAGLSSHPSYSFPAPSSNSATPTSLPSTLPSPR